MGLDRYLKILDAAYRNHDGPSMARCLSSQERDIPYGKDFVPYLDQARKFYNTSLSVDSHFLRPRFETDADRKLLLLIAVV